MLNVDVGLETPSVEHPALQVAKVQTLGQTLNDSEQDKIKSAHYPSTKQRKHVSMKEGRYVGAVKQGIKLTTHRPHHRLSKAMVDTYLNCEKSSSSSSDEDNGSRGEETLLNRAKPTQPQPMKPQSCPGKGEKTGPQRAMQKKPWTDEKNKSLSPKKCAAFAHNCQNQQPVSASVHAEYPKTKLQADNDTSLVLSDIDVAVGVGTNCYSLMSHPGNIALNDSITHALPAVSAISGKTKTQWVRNFINQLEAKGTRFLVLLEEGSSFRIASDIEKYNTVIRRFRNKKRKKPARTEVVQTINHKKR